MRCGRMLFIYTLAWSPSLTPSQYSASPARFGVSSTKTPYFSTERTIPGTVSPALNAAEFSSQVPSSSRCESVRRPNSSQLLTMARMFCPVKNRAFGCGMRDTEMLSMGSSALIPAPMSQNAPKGSMCVTHASITSPQTSDDRYSRLQSS